MSDIDRRAFVQSVAASMILSVGGSFDFDDIQNKAWFDHIISEIDHLGEGVRFDVTIATRFIRWRPAEDRKSVKVDVDARVIRVRTVWDGKYDEDRAWVHDDCEEIRDNWRLFTATFDPIDMEWSTS